LEQNVESYRDYVVQYSYVIDARGRLVGVLRMRDLLLAPRDLSIGRLMLRDPLTVRDTSNLDELRSFFSSHAFFGVPVVDSRGVLLGLVQRSDVEQAQADRAGTDYLKSQGIVGGEELRTMPLWQRSRRRLAWLSINIVLNVVAASVIAFYQETLAAVIALAVFLPIISDMSGCSGNQAVAVSMRELSLGLVRPAEVFRVWLKDWAAAASGGPVFPLHLRAAAGEVALDLRLLQGKPAVLQGDRGLSRKSAELGNASYYYSLTRLPAAGTLRVGDERLVVTGAAWMDREWSTSSLGRDQVGWDWFALQLSDGSDLMLYQLRRRDGTADPTSSGTLVGPAGRSRSLAPSDFALEVLDQWTSPDSGIRYPARWRLRAPSELLDLVVSPRLADQELDLAFRYWEGAVALEGTRAGRPVSGQGYAELTGYTPP